MSQTLTQPVSRGLIPENLSRRVAWIASYIAMLTGLVVLIGWSLDLPWLKGTIPSAATNIKANTALCFILAGASLGLQARSQSSSSTTRWAQGCAIAVGVIGFATLMEYLWGWNLGIDELLFQDDPFFPPPYPGRMGDNTALCFALVGLALWLNPQKIHRRNSVVQTAAICTIAIALLALTGYAYNVQIFYRFIVYSTQMSILTAFILLTICLGILALQAHCGLMKELTSNSIGSINAQQLIPIAVIVPFMLGWLILQGLEANLYDPAFSIALLVVSLVSILVLVIWKTAQKLNRIDYDRKRAYYRLQSSEAQLQLAVQGAGQGIWDWNFKTQVLTWDQRCKEIFGLPPDFPVTYEWHLNALHPDDRQSLVDATEMALRDRTEFDKLYRTFHPDGTLHWVLARGRCYYNTAGEPRRMAGTVMDVTERKQAQLNDQFLNDLDLRLRKLSDAEAMAWEVVSSLGNYLTVDRCLWHKIDWENRLTTVERNWRQKDIPDVAGIYALDEYFTPAQLDYFAAGQTLIVYDVTTHPDTAPYAQKYLSLGAGAFVSVPCIQSGCWVAVLTVNAKTARNWRDDEVMLLQETTARLWSIIEEARVVQALFKSEQELFQSNHLKDEFLAAISHELRTPLHLMLGWTTILRKQMLTPDETNQALETIERSIRQQILLVNDLLDISSTLQGKLHLEFQSVDLALLLADVIQSVSLTAQAKSISIHSLGISSLQTLGDRDRLQQIFWNLLSNAIKFTPERGQVKVNLAMVKNIDQTCSAQLQIVDTGIGIPSDFLPYVFNYFRQADGGLNRKYGGLGLGLAIVQHLVELHGGTVQVESPGEGKGTTFTLLLPLSK